MPRLSKVKDAKNAWDIVKELLELDKRMARQKVTLPTGLSHCNF